jgi:membrane protein required for beta-lactamase induction
MTMLRQYGWYLLLIVWLVVSFSWPAEADNTPGTDMNRLIQANEKQAEALEKIAKELEGIKGKCK